MAIESAVIFRRVARIVCLVLSCGLLSGGAAMAQLPITFTPGNPPPVTVGSVIPFYHGSSGMWSQVYSMKVDHYGNILFLDSAASNLYELQAGAAEPSLILTQAPKNVTSDCTDLENSQSAGYWNAAIAFDAWNNLYITDRYGSTHFCRVPWNAATGTWTFSGKDIWTNGPTYTAPGSTATPLSTQDLQVGDDGTFYASSSTAMTAGIFKFTVDQSGNVLTSVPLAVALEDMVSNLAVDHAGNVFFIENAYDSTSKRVTGILEIAAGTTVTGCDGTGSCEKALPRIDPASYGFNGIKGLTFDDLGNLYFNSTNNASYGGQVDGIFMIPNEGTKTNPKLVWDDTVMVAPLATGFPVLIDPRGWMWVETYGSNNWAPTGSSAPPCSSTDVNECMSAGMLIWKPGTALVGASPVSITGYSSGLDSNGNNVVKLTANNSLTASQLVTISATAGDGLYALNGLSFYVSSEGLTSTLFEIPSSAVTGGGTSSAQALATQTLYYSFSGTDPKSTGITPSAISLTQPGAKNFTLLSTNPVVNTATIPAVPPCTAGTLYPKWSGIENAVGTYSWCTQSVVLNAHTTGSVEGELQLLDSNGNAYVGSNAYLSGVGNGAAASMISSAAIQTIAKGLDQPMQVAGDALGNSYVADSALKEIEFYPAGSSSATGINIGANLTAPTGVAVDGVGNVFIGDSGSVYEVPVKTKSAALPQTVLLSGLGNHLNLAADASGDVFVADMDNKQVVEIPNPQTSLLLTGGPTLVLAPDAGFKGPSAITTDSKGNVWVADGANLWEIGMPLGVPSEVITSGLSAPVTGLAVDPSGSVFVAGANGITWIPFSTTTGSLNPSSTVQVLTGLGATNAETPNSIAMDGFENLYATYGSGAANTGMAQVGIGGTMNFDNNGEVNPNVPSEDDAQIFNIGNMGLTFDPFSQSGSLETTAGTYVFSGANAADFMAQQATENSPACGSSTVTAPGSFCYLGLVLTSATPTYPAQATGSVAAMSNAVNAPSGINIAMSGRVIQDFRWASTTTVTIMPASGAACGTSTGSVYPGCQTVTVVVTPQAGEPSSVGTPGGQVIVSAGSASGSLPKQTLTLDGTGTATYTYPALQGGTYTINALFGAEGTAGAAQNTCAGGTPCFAGSVGQGSFTITPATPAFVVGVPVTHANCLNPTTGADGNPSSNCTPDPAKLTIWAGNTYVISQQPSWVYVSVKSAVGVPTGTVSFLVPSAKGLVPADPSQGVNGNIPLNGNGIAAFSLAGLANGVYNLTVQYNGDTNYAVASTSGSSNVVFQIIDPSAQICVGCSQSTAPAATLSITAGTPATVNLTLMPLVGFAEFVSLQCVNLPPNSECTFLYPNSSNGTVSVGKITTGVASTIELTISTNVPVNGTTITSSIERKTPWSLAGLFGLGLVGLIAGRKKVNRYVTMICLAAMLAGALIGVTACTNAGYSTPPKVQSTPTPAGTYQVGVISYNPAIGPSQPNSLATQLFTLAVTVQ